MLLALLDVGAPGISGTELQDRLARHSTRPGADTLLVSLLRLEGSGHVVVQRSPSMRFALTEHGRDRAYEVGGGRPVHLQLLMADLVGFTSFTSVHGDAAARAAAGALHQAASDAIRSGGGEVVKSMGDGVLAWLPHDRDPVPVVRSMASAFARPDGEPWLLRAASHVGRPIRHGGDLFGNDVNLVARLCGAASPGELVCSSIGDAAAELLEVRGLEDAVPVRRMAIL